MQTYSVILPEQNSLDKTVTIDNVHTMVVIGANGAGKSRLGHWIEYSQNPDQFVHRLSAQRIVQMDSEVWPMSYEEAEDGLLYGSSSNKRKKKKDPKHGRWGDEPITGMHWDFDSVLGLLYAEEEQRNRCYVKKVKTSKRKISLPQSSLDVLKITWEQLFPHRKIDLESNKFITTTNDGYEYSASNMSDGERVVFYLLGQCLLVPEKSIIVIDEPEIHIHRSLQTVLWNKIQELREDCCFIYLTHDLDFAAYRETENKIWLKSYDGESWDWEKVPPSDIINEEIILEILGSRKPILFVEGEKNSYDHKIYQAIYSNYLVMPRGSCTKVIESTKALKSIPSLHHLKIKGLIDRDYRSDAELNKLQRYGIKTIDVAEIENLLCVEELIYYIAEIQELNPEVILSKVKKFIIKAFKQELESQVSRKSSFDIKYQLGMFEDTPKGIDDINRQLDTLLNSIDTNKIYNGYYTEFSEYIDENDYANILKVFNRKSLSERISESLGLAKNTYPSFVLRYINSSHKKKITSILQKYTPNFK